MTRIRSYLAVCALALFVPVFVAGCGGDDDDSSDVDPQTVLDETFNNDERVSSGDLSLSLDGSIEGDEAGSFEASLSGPFQGDPENATAIPQLDFTGSISGEAAGQSLSFEGGLTVTDDNAYVEYGGNAYEVGAETFGQFKQLAEQAAAQQTEAEGLSFTEAFTQGCEQSIKSQGGDTAACDIDFAAWLGEPTSEGTEDIEGTESDHISGSVNVEPMLQDLLDLGTATGETLPAGSEDQIAQIAEASEVTFDLYSGTEDRILRGVDFNVAVDVSAIDDPSVAEAGADGADVTFSMRLGGVNEEQTIEGPSDAQPIEELLGQFGVDPGSLGGLGGLDALGGGAGGGGLPGGGGGGGGAGSANADAYLDCISQATTPDEINACASDL